MAMEQMSLSDAGWLRGCIVRGACIMLYYIQYVAVEISGKFLMIFLGFFVVAGDVPVFIYL